jgi:cytochrome o ubiquinol oxidase operon protein cyoD
MRQEHPAPTEPQPRLHQGSLQSYVTGFVLSLAFTLIPYYLVTRKPSGGNAVLGAIIAFAVIQLVIQVVFFLHLGRDRRQRFNVFFLLFTLGTVFFVVVSSLWIMTHLQANMSAMEVTDKIASGEAVHQISGVQAGTCPGGTVTNHKVVLHDNKVTPGHTYAKLCDTLTIINNDSAMRDMEFGEHDHHVPYSGQSGELLRPGRSMQVTLTEQGTYLFHDHMQDVVQGDFTVTK